VESVVGTGKGGKEERQKFNLGTFKHPQEESGELQRGRTL